MPPQEPLYHAIDSPAPPPPPPVRVKMALAPGQKLFAELDADTGLAES